MTSYSFLSVTCDDIEHWNCKICVIIRSSASPPNLEGYAVLYYFLKGQIARRN